MYFLWLVILGNNGCFLLMVCSDYCYHCMKSPPEGIHLVPLSMLKFEGCCRHDLHNTHADPLLGGIYIGLHCRFGGDG